MGSKRSNKILIMLIFIFTLGFSLTSCFMFFMDWDPAAVEPSAVITGTITTATEADIMAGGMTLIITLTGDTWLNADGMDGTTDNDYLIETANILIDGLVHTSGSDDLLNIIAALKADITGADNNAVIRTSDTVITITLPAVSLYVISADEVISMIVPASMLTTTTTVVNCTPDITISMFYLINENFDDGFADNWTDDASGYWNVAGFEYVLSVIDVVYGRYSSYYNETDNLSFSDFTFEADVKQFSGYATENEAGLFFRVNDGELTDGDPEGLYTGYRLYIRTDGAFVSYWALEIGNGVTFTPVQAVAFGTDNVNINCVFGDFNKIKVVCQGSQIDVYFNDVFIQSYTDSTYTGGYVGVFGTGALIANNFRFDNVRLWQ